MYVNVKFLNGWKDQLTYKVPDDWSLDEKNLIGALVNVPLQRRIEPAIVMKILKEGGRGPYKIKEIENYDVLFNDSLYQEFLGKLSLYYCVEKEVFLRRFFHFLKEKEKKIISFNPEVVIKEDIVLSDEQKFITNEIEKFLINKKFSPSVIKGVTGSGKSEIYADIIKKNFLNKQSTILLLPEVSLAIKFAKFFRKRCGDIPVLSFHSAVGKKEKRELWDKIRSSEPVLIIGVHLPIFLPVKNLGLIIIDEEHEPGYQEKRHPKINSKEVAIIRAKINKIPIVLGSATPSISTLYNVVCKKWKIFELKKRFAGAFPLVKIVKLSSKDVKKRSNFWISEELEKSIKSCLKRKEQALIFLNRRGYSFFIQCSSCGEIFNCSSCAVSLTYHQDGYLHCHYCGFKIKPPQDCPKCFSKKLIKRGVGTQQIVGILEKIFPDASIARADTDVSKKKKLWNETLDNFRTKKIDILVGTQIISKGHHFPGVTLVGILWADMYLGFPFYNAVETTLQQIVQVAGRAGRQSEESLVVVQTMLEHEVFDYVRETNYSNFYKKQIAVRKELHYPPIVRFAEIELRNTDENILEQEVFQVIKVLKNVAQKNKLKTKILGPAKPPVSKIKNVYIYKLYLKDPNAFVINKLYKHLLLSLKLESSIFFVPNPLSI